MNTVLPVFPSPERDSVGAITICAMSESSTTSELVAAIDLELWRSGSDAERQSVQRLVDKALTNIGFLIVTNHGFPSETIDELRASSHDVFSLPTDTKARYKQGDGIGGPGWCPIGVEANAYASGQETPPDLKEAWSVAPLGEGAMVPTSHGPIRSNNVFPDEVPGFEPAVRAYLDAGMALTAELFELLALAIGEPPDTFSKLCATPLHTLNLTWYPPLVDGDDIVEAEPNQFRIGPHCDFGTITILHREPSDPPLQVQHPDGSWNDLPHVPDSFIVNVGDQLAYWSGDHWRSNPHRIEAPAGEAAEVGRLSLVLFVETDVGAILQPIGKPDAEPMDAVEFLTGKLAAIDMSIS